MELKFQEAVKSDASLLIALYNASFYDDFVSYGACPAYGKSLEEMETSIETYKKYILYYDQTAVGVLSYQAKEKDSYYVGCLCVIPKYQGKGFGTKAMAYIEATEAKWRELHLITPADKEKNIKFYTQICGFSILNEEMDGNVKVYHFVKKRV